MAILRKNKKWQVRVYDGSGGRFPARTFIKKVDAEKYERELLSLRDSGHTVNSLRAGQKTFMDYAALWEGECRSSVSDGWRRSQSQLLRDHVLPILGTTKVGDVRKRDIELVIKSVRDKGLSPQSCRHVYNLLSRAFQDALLHFECVSINPVSLVKAPIVPKKERNFLRLSEAKLLMNSCQNHWLGPAIWLGIAAGMRAGEIQALNWDSVDFENKFILIRSSFKRKEGKIEDWPKQKDWGKTPMVPDLAKYLRSLAVGKERSGFVVLSPRVEMLSYNSFYRGLIELCKQAGVRRVTPHELRHSTAELFMSYGASSEDMRRVLNHSSVKSTEGYIHRTEERVSSIAAKIEISEPLKLVK